MRIAVKQLEWPPECPRGQRVRSRPNALIRYAIAHYGPDGVSGGTIYRWASEGGKWSEPFKTYDAAKHAAQGDYRDRVLTEISVDGDDASDALVAVRGGLEFSRRHTGPKLGLPRRH